jgi:hypothetical protein
MFSLFIRTTFSLGTLSILLCGPFTKEAFGNFEELCSGPRGLITYSAQDAASCFVAGAGEANCRRTLENMMVRARQFQTSSSQTCEKISELQRTMGSVGQTGSYEQATQVAQTGLAAVNQLSQQALDIARLTREDGRRNLSIVGRTIESESSRNAQGRSEQNSFRSRADSVYSSADLNQFRGRSLEDPEASRVTAPPEWRRQAITLGHNSRFIRDLLTEKEKLDNASKRISSMLSELQARTRDNRSSSTPGSGLNPSALAQMAPALAALAQKPGGGDIGSGISGQDPSSSASMGNPNMVQAEATKSNSNRQNVLGKVKDSKGDRIERETDGKNSTDSPELPPSFVPPASSDISQRSTMDTTFSKGSSSPRSSPSSSRASASSATDSGGSGAASSTPKAQNSGHAEALQPFQEELTGGMGHGGGFGAQAGSQPSEEPGDPGEDTDSAALPEVFDDLKDSWEDEQKAEASGSHLLDSELSLFERVRKCHHRRLLQGKVLDGLGEDLGSLNLINKSK